MLIAIAVFIVKAALVVVALAAASLVCGWLWAGMKHEPLPPVTWNDMGRFGLAITGGIAAFIWWALYATYIA